MRNVGYKNDVDYAQTCGIAYQADPINEPGRLLVEFPGSFPANYLVLGTDYDTYAAVYSCFEQDGEATIFAWVLARDPIALPETVRFNARR